MGWIDRLSRTEIEEAGRLADRMSAEELDAESIRYGRLDGRFRWFIVPSSLVPSYVIMFLREVRIISTAEMAGYLALLGLLFMLAVILIAREVWYRWCVVELALLLRRKRDTRTAGRRDPEDSQYAITE